MSPDLEPVMTPREKPRRPRRFDVVTVGESMILVTPAGSESLESAKAFTLDVGGAESNVAVHLHQMGHRVRFLGAVGDDALGRRICYTLRSAGLDISHVKIDPEASTGVYFKDPGQAVYYYRSGSAASRLGPEAVTDEVLNNASVVHLTGITPALSDQCRALAFDVAHRARRAGVIVSVDVNYRPALWPIEIAANHLLKLCQLADIVFVGLDEARQVWGCTTPADVRALFPNVARVVVKNDSVGATEFQGDDEVFVASRPVEVVEAVGAGDAFAAGYLSGVLQGFSSESCLRLGHERAEKTLLSMADYPKTDDQGVS